MAVDRTVACDHQTTDTQCGHVKRPARFRRVHRIAVKGAETNKSVRAVTI